MIYPYSGRADFFGDAPDAATLPRELPEPHPHGRTIKRWEQNVQAPIVQQVRGSLGAHEQGLIITTSDFSAGAKQEAERADATPVALMDWVQLVKLLVENDIGVRRTKYDLIELRRDGDAEEAPAGHAANG